MASQRQPGIVGLRSQCTWLARSRVQLRCLRTCRLSGNDHHGASRGTCGRRLYDRAVSKIDPAVWQDRATRRAIAARDITAVYRHLVAMGVTQRVIAEAVGQSPSEVSEILAGRQVQSYDVLVRVADGLGVPRGWMGLAYDASSPSVPSDEEEVDEDVKRRNLLAVAGTVLFAQPVFGVPDAKALTFREVITNPPKRIGMPDVATFEQVTARLGVLDREAGGIAARETLAAVAQGGEQLPTAQATDLVHQRLRGALSEAHRLAGWASGDVGLMDHCRWHMQQAMSHAEGDPVRLAGVMASAGDMEKHYGAPDEALKFFQLATAGLPHGADRQVGARGARSVGLGVPRPRARAAYDVRCRVLDTIVLATILVNAGELSGGIIETRRVFSLVTAVGSQRVRDRLEPLEQALLARRDSTCQDLARRIRTLRAPQEPDTTV